MLVLRGEDLSFAAIATRLHLRRSKDALEAFHRALNSRSEIERPELIRQEMGRLASLEARIRTRDESDPEKMNHRLRALEQMRQRLSPSHDGP
ncbi:MAG: hypothetical protein ACRDZ5_05255 [Acidimicrobiales bacterium]